MEVIGCGYFWWITGFVVGQIYLLADARVYGLKKLPAFLCGAVNLIVMCIGAKIMYIIENFGYVLSEGLGFQGFSLFGAIFIMPLSAVIAGAVFKIPTKRALSVIVIPTVIMLGFYRIDCFISGCCGGIEFNGFVFPTQLTECVFCMIFACVLTILTHRRKLPDGISFCLFLIAYGVFRFIIEFVRVRQNIFWLISLSHVWAAVAVAAGIILLVFIGGKRSQCSEKNL